MAIFIDRKHEKNNYGSYLVYKYFLHFKLLAYNTIKDETKEKFKNLLEMNLVKYSSTFLAHIKKHLGHTDTPANVQNNCIKLSGFGVDITSFFEQREITRSILCREMFFRPKILSQVFRTSLTYFFHFLCCFISG